ncbi:hypothetical protein BRADI_2g36451v3 [Brachypodium distachyon]|uniref:Protein kinase domain-containing protein n=1 Tax=Brachypodium distachyon TaxID=15368 RepID=A0A0Q3G8A4_BRADI|nr:hypothetical protein BRADI_2g36451v3 [Brachypodium distachyon]
MHCAYESEEVECLYDYSLRFRLHELTQVPGCSLTLKLAKLTTKVVILRCYSQLAKLHEDGFSLGGCFTLRNFMIFADDTIKVTNLADGAILSFSDSNGDLDYWQFVKMVQDEVFLKQAVPDDLHEWLRIVSRGIKACHRNLLANHIHLMEAFQGYGTFVSMYQQFRTIEGSDGWADLLNSLGHYFFVRNQRGGGLSPPEFHNSKRSFTYS